MPPKKLPLQISSTATNDKENDRRRQDTIFLDDRIRVMPSRSRTWWHRVGWPVGAMGSAMLATTALLINVVVSIWTLNTFKLERGVAEVFVGSCHESERINTWLRLGINAVSTMLLSGSNYCMQILSAPTRNEIDNAHAAGKWLDIGVPSAKNLRYVAMKKVILWWLLGLSSVPLHLMYNSVFFSTIATNEYDVVFANEAFVEGGPNGSWDEAEFPGINHIQAQAKSWERLDKLSCLNAYAVEFLNTRRHLVVVVVDNAMVVNASVKDVKPAFFEYDKSSPMNFNPYSWICRAPHGETRYGWTEEENPLNVNSNNVHCAAIVSKVKAHAERWHIDSWDVDYCLSERVEGKCSLSFSLPIIVVVMICNVIKAGVMLFIAFRIREKPLITIGDAIDSFLDTNDPATEGMCLVTKESIHAAETLPSYVAVVPYWHAVPVRHKPKFKQLRHSASGTRWWTSMTLLVERTPRNYVTDFEQIFSLRGHRCHFARIWDQRSQRIQWIEYII